MSTRLTGSICVTDLVAMAKAKHSSMNVSAKNGKLYANITIWINDEPDAKTGNVLSVVLNGKQANEAADLAMNGGKKAYIANAKYAEAKAGGTAATDLDVNMGAYGGAVPPAPTSHPWDAKPTGDLPF